MSRIVILTSSHPAFDTRIFQKEARALAKAGFEVLLIVPHSGDELVDGVQIRAVARSSSRLGRWILAPIRVLRAALRERGDVYHFHDPELIPAGLVLRLAGRRVIYDVHEDLPRDLKGKAYIPRFLRGPLAGLVGVVQQLAARAFNLVVLARDDIRAAFRGHPRVEVVSNYPSRSLADSGAQPGTAMSGGPIRIAYVGGMSPVRGIRECVEALAALPPGSASLDLYGRLAPADYAEAIRGLPSFAAVTLHGVIPYDQVPRVLARADIGIVCFLPEPNNINSGPTKLFEYMICALPVIASDFPEWRAIIDGAGCGTCVDPSDPADIARGILALGTDRDRLRAMGERGRVAVLERYNWETEAERLLARYRELLAQ